MRLLHGVLKINSVNLSNQSEEHEENEQHAEIVRVLVWIRHTGSTISFTRECATFSNLHDLRCFLPSTTTRREPNEKQIPRNSPGAPSLYIRTPRKSQVLIPRRPRGVPTAVLRKCHPTHLCQVTSRVAIN